MMSYTWVEVYDITEEMMGHIDQWNVRNIHEGNSWVDGLSISDSESSNAETIISFALLKTKQKQLQRVG